MEFNQTIRHSLKRNVQRIFIFDSTSPPKEVRLASFGKAEVTFGRDPANNIVLMSHLASRCHGKFVCENGQWKAVDLGSTNGLISNDEVYAELPVAEGGHFRIDDGIETVADGALVIFPSEDYSEDWSPIRMAGNKILLNVIEPLTGSYIEHSGDSFYLNLSSSAPDIRINHREAQRRTLLHEKDFIETTGYRIVFTSTALYYNRLRGGRFSGQSGQAQPVEEDQRYGRAKASASAASGNSGDARSAPFAHAEYAQEPGRAAQGSGERLSSRSKEDCSADRSNENSVKRFFASAGGYYLMVIVFALIIWGITFILWTSQSEIAIVVMLVCAYFGWNALNSIQPAMFIWMPWVGWLIYVIVKFILSAIIGLFVAPFRLGRSIASIVNSSAQ